MSSPDNKAEELDQPGENVVVGATTGSAAPRPDALSGKGVGVDRQKSDRFPAGIPFIVGNEGAERFSFYGMRAILYVYMASLYAQLAPGITQEAANAQATQLTHLFMAGVYLFPMIGAIIADRLLGKYHVILWVSMLYTVGQGVLAFAGHLGTLGELQSAELFMYIGLAVVAVGSGGIKPCVSANVGDQFGPENAHLVSKVFQIFYFIINFGSFFSTLITPFLYLRYGPAVAFGVPGVLMAVATLVFWMGRKKFRKVAPNPGGKLGLLDSAASIFMLGIILFPIAGFLVGHGAEEGAGSTQLGYVLGGIVSLGIGLALFAWRQRIQRDSGFLAVSWYAITNQKKRQPGQGFFSVATEEFGEEGAAGPPAVLRIMVVFSMVTLFWALFDQHSSTWIEQARSLDRTLSIPYWFSAWVAAAVIVSALYGLLWLMLWVSNVSLPKKLTVGLFSVIGVAGVAAVGYDVLGGVPAREMELAAPQLAALNPLLVMMIIPAMNFGVYRPLEKRGIVIKPLMRMTLGMFLAAAGFGAAALLQEAIDGAAEAPFFMWQALQYLIITTAEVLVSITGLEFAYTQAPRSMKSTIMGFWLLTVTFGNVLVAFMAPLQASMGLAQFFWTFTALMGAAAVIFAVLAKFYKGRTWLQE